MTEKLECQNEMMNGRYCDNPAEWTATCPSVVGGTWQTVYCWRCKDVGVGHVVTSWARILPAQPAPFTLDGDDPLAASSATTHARAAWSEAAQLSLFPLHTDRKPSRKATIAAPTFMDWLDANPANA